ncbi:MAG: B12-binding domain-containing radical SAM protein [Promethearchaeota archaeon]|jgi:radical SAM superfamily enzyme YgiQ (UPF0313 family)
MKITLIWPCIDYLSTGGTEEPLGLLYIASILRNQGVEVSFIDLNGEKDLSICEQGKDADIIGIASTTPLFGRARKVLDYLRKRNTRAMYVVGGPHATVCTEDALDSGFDIAVLGEGEVTVSELISAWRAGDPYSARGIAYKKNGQLHLNERPPFIEDLDMIPFPWREKVNYSLYRAIGVMASRGCPYRCAFCKPTQDKLFGARIRKRSVKNVVDEIEQCFRMIGKRKITFKDDTLTLYPRDWFEEFYEELCSRKLGVKWQCNSSIRSLTFEKLKAMKKAGCIQVCMGIESGSQKILDFYKKSQTPEEVIQVFNWCHKLNLRPYTFLMVGAPMETVEDLEKTYQLVRKVKPFNGHLCTLTPLPGTGVHEYCQKRGIIKPMTYEDYDNAVNTELGQTLLNLDYLTNEDLTKYAAKITSYLGRRVLINSLFSFQIWLEFLRSPGFRRRAKKLIRRYVYSALRISRRKGVSPT